MAGGALKYRHLDRKSSHRQALLRNLVTSLFTHESISTTWPKAKEAQRLAEKLITLGKKNTDAAKRKAEAIFYVRLPFPLPPTTTKPPTGTIHPPPPPLHHPPPPLPPPPRRLHARPAHRAPKPAPRPSAQRDPGARRRAQGHAVCDDGEDTDARARDGGGGQGDYGQECGEGDAVSGGGGGGVGKGGSEDGDEEGVGGGEGG